MKPAHTPSHATALDGQREIDEQWDYPRLAPDSKLFQFFDLCFGQPIDESVDLIQREGLVVLQSKPVFDDALVRVGKRKKTIDVNVCQPGDAVVAVQGNLCGMCSVDEIKQMLKHSTLPLRVTFLRFNSTKLPSGLMAFRPTTSGRKCAHELCDKYDAGRGFCKKHGGGTRCQFEGCVKSAKSNGLCKAHGGGRRCQFENCKRAAKEPTRFCYSHGGGKRCSMPGCTRIACAGFGDRCRAHGGGKKCSVENCETTAVSLGFCIKHGGGRRCSVEGCRRLTRGRVGLCALHGGGTRCSVPGCGRPMLRKGQSKMDGPPLCYTHGGGKRCARLECQKLAVDSDFCLGHGGGTPCEVPGCKKAARSMKLRRCWRHLGNKKICLVEHCSTIAKVKGYCKRHYNDRLPLASAKHEAANNGLDQEQQDASESRIKDAAAHHPFDTIGEEHLGGAEEPKRDKLPDLGPDAGMMVDEVVPPPPPASQQQAQESDERATQEFFL